MSNSSSMAASLADALRQETIRVGTTTAAVRGGDGRLAVVQTVGSDGTITTTDGIIARRLEDYRNPTVGDLVALMCFSSGVWIVLGRTAAAADTAWTAYTPTWTAATTNPVVNNGTLIGRYQKHGRTVVVHINLVPGSSTTFGSGIYAFALPFTSANVGASFVGTAQLLGSARWLGETVISPNVLTTSPFFPTNTTTTTASQMSPTVPITFASGNQLRMTLVYESAS